MSKWYMLFLPTFHGPYKGLHASNEREARAAFREFYGWKRLPKGSRVETY